MADPIVLKRKLIITFTIMLVLILMGGALGWILTQKIERNSKIVDVVHQFKEAELQLRREEKNLLIRGYSQERFLRWQNAKEQFHQRFGELMGMEALSDSEINEIKADYSEMSSTYNNFFEQIRSNALNQDGINKYSEQFKVIGRRTLGMINNILSREAQISAKTDSQADILIAAFTIIFVATSGFLIVNVLKHL